ncbi:MAG: hydroxymethylbilane synthase, partial [Actinobacteria bacterium]|nr:hydroxymethylbilane synthase [Actinomycetota bacterium]
MTVPPLIRLATRPTPLARAQSALVVRWLRALGPDLQVEIVPIRSAGDVDQTRPIEALGRGAFAKAVQAALLDGRADLAVHSFKDLPTTPALDLTVAAVPVRADPRDVLVAGPIRSVAALPHGAVVGTDSPRRRTQLALQRPDVVFVPIRGSVETRVRKVADGTVAATVLARAGLERAGLAQAISAVLEPPDFLPAPAQGALAVETRATDIVLRRLVERIDDPAARAATTAERAFLRTLEGGCSVPA